MGNTHHSHISDILNINACYKLSDKTNPLTNMLDSTNIMPLIGTIYDLIIYSYYNKYNELHILHNIYKSTSLINQNILIDRILFYYNINCTAVNTDYIYQKGPPYNDTNIILLKEISEFKLTSTYPIFMLNLCSNIDSGQFIKIMSTLLTSYIIKQEILVADQIDFIKLLGCHLDKSTDYIQLRQKTGLLINTYMECKDVNIKLLNCLINLNLQGVMPYNSYKYIRSISPKDKPKNCKFGNNVEKLSDNDLYRLIIPCSAVSYNVWYYIYKQGKELEYIERMRRINKDLNYVNIGVDYIFSGMRQSVFRNINNIGLYLIFVLRCFDVIQDREIIGIGQAFVDYIVKVNGNDTILENIGIYALMKELLDKSNGNNIIKHNVGNYKTLLDYYLSTINEINTIKMGLVQIMLDKGMICTESNQILIDEAQVETKDVITSLI